MWGNACMSKEMTGGHMVCSQVLKSIDEGMKNLVQS